MQLTTTRPDSNRFLALAGLSAAAAGAIFIGVQIGHPPADLEHLVTTEMAVREGAKALMSVLAIVGLTGMLWRHRDRVGVLGRLGYGLVSLGYLAMFAAVTVQKNTRDLALGEGAAEEPGRLFRWPSGSSQATTD